MKLEIGDKIKVKNLEISNEKYTTYVNWYMRKLSNKICTISYLYTINIDGKLITVYRLKEDLDCWNWTSDMFCSNFKYNSHFIYLQNIV